MEKVTEKALELLRQLAVEAGKSVEHFWPIFVRQQFLEAVTAFAIGGTFVLAGGIVGIYCWHRSNQLMKEYAKHNRYDDVDNSNGFAICAVIAWVASAIALAITLGSSLAQLLNPEYYAIQSLVRMGTGK